MAQLEEKFNPTDKVEIVGPYKHVQVRSATWVEKDGEVIGGKQYHRTVFSPGDSSDNAEIQAIIDTVHTPKIIAAYEAHLAEQQQNEE
jgi:hypothetical protein